MAVRNINAINNRSKQIQLEQKNLADARMARVNRAMDIIRGCNDDIIDAIDTLSYMRIQGFVKQALTVDNSNEFAVYNSYTGDKRHVRIYCYGEETSRSYDQHYIDYFPDTRSFECWSCLGWGGFDKWDPETGKYHDEYFLPLLEKLASKIEIWCQSVFELSENL